VPGYHFDESFLVMAVELLKWEGKDGRKRKKIKTVN